ncbi:MAG: HAMP domain-containing sensor histidine kinase [Paracoccaceae bacterium]|nr:HAMP domain-containing sensor histidine kinase [Paracoccaceae bacterium]
MFTNTLSGRFLILTILFVMLAEVFIFVPSIARFRQDYMINRLERAQIASLALLADDMIEAELEQELLKNAGVYNVVLRRDEVRQLVLSSDMPLPVGETFDIRDPSAGTLIMDASSRLLNPEPEVIRVIGTPAQDAGLLIEVTMPSEPLRNAMIDYGIRILILSAVISVFTATLLFFAVRFFLVKPIKGVVSAMKSYAAAPEDARRIIAPQASVKELAEAEQALKSMQTDLTSMLRQRERLASLGSAVAKISHDLRNILTSAQLFADRIESSQDPTVARMAPKLMNSIGRAVNLCESTLAFGKAEEPPPALSVVSLAAIAQDVVDGEQLAAEGTPICIAQTVPAGLMVRADPEQLYRVLSNLVRNARQAIAATGKDGKIRIDASESERAWSISVSDDGPGLPPRAQEHLFTPFQGTASKGGAGLGLAIAAELVRGHGGNLTLDTTGPDGTVFHVELPKSVVVTEQAAE